MEGCALLAMAIGALAATALPVIAFCIGLLVALVVGLVAGLILFPDPLAVLIGAIVLFAAVQVGYGIGLSLWALMPQRRASQAKGAGRAPASSKDHVPHPR